MSLAALEESISTWLDILQYHESLDPINDCPASTLQLLPLRPSALIKLSHSKIHSFQFSLVPTCWRRLYTDASIFAALHLLRGAIAKSKVRDGADPGDASEATEEVIPSEDVDEVVRLLDMAQIITGAPLRNLLIEQILAHLQILVDGEAYERPQKKRRLEADRFPKVGLNVPKITFPLSRVSNPTMARFEEYLDGACPMILANALTHWPALDERPWNSPSYLLKKTIGGRRLVPVELGRSYTDEGWGQSIMKFKDFMDGFVLPPDPSAMQQNANGFAYLAQHDLFAQIPSLRNDISIPDYCYSDPPPAGQGTPLSRKPELPKVEEPFLNAWFGPAGTVSPLHTDPYHNILCQVVGRKYVRLYTPLETEKMYPQDVGEGGVDMSNTSQVDAEAERHETEQAFPLFNKAKYVEAILNEGEALYIPVGWWHYVRSLDVSFSVSFWWN